LTEKERSYLPLMTRFYMNYSMLVINSFGLQNALERSKLDVGHFFGRCHTSAMACALIVRDELGPLGYLRYSPDSHFVLSSYAVLTLLKLIRPEFQSFMENQERTIALVNDVADTLESVAASASHTPALYSTFLRAVASARTSGPSVPASPRPTTGDGRMTMNNGESPLDQVSGPAAGVYGDEHQFGDGALGLKMFPPAPHISNEVSWNHDGSGAEMDLQPSAFNPQQTMDDFSSMSMDSILSGGFWDNVLIPGYSTGLEGLTSLSGGFVYGSGGSGLITPRRSSPEPESPSQFAHAPGDNAMSQRSINSAFASTS